MRNNYDVVIIGAGIGGLVCGCYLSRSGLKTLIVEKNVLVGGYCTSFEKSGFVFDSCAGGIECSLRFDGHRVSYRTDIRAILGRDLGNDLGFEHDDTDRCRDAFYGLCHFKEF